MGSLASDIISDGKSLALFGVSTLKSAIDGLFGQAADDIPTLTGDGVKSVEAAVEQHVPSAALGLVNAALGIAGGAVESIETEANVAAVAALHQASVSVDAAFAALSAKVDVSASATVSDAPVAQEAPIEEPTEDEATSE
jgi:hypothetical protein